MDATTNAIEVRNLAKGYKGVPVLHDVSFTVERGTVFALLGANGSGKTTTINILTTLINADGGTASVAGFDVAEQPAKVREQISLTGQFAAVDDVLTARENLVLMGELRHVADPAADRGGPARQVRPQRGRRPPPADLLGRDATPARHRHEPGRATHPSSSSTSRRPGSTPRAGPTCG